MAMLGPLPQLLGAAAMIGLAVVTAFGFRRPAAGPPKPELTPAAEMRAALARFAHWLPAQPAGVRAAVAGPTEMLLTRGTELVEAVAGPAETAGGDGALLTLPAVIAARHAIVRDLPDTIALLEGLPMAGRTVPRPLRHFTGALNAIAEAVATGADAAQAAVATELEIQQGYLGAKYPPRDS